MQQNSAHRQEQNADRVPPRKKRKFSSRRDCVSSKSRRKQQEVNNPALQAASGTEEIAPPFVARLQSPHADSERPELHHCPFHCGAEGFGSVPALETHLRDAYCDTADDKHKIHLLANEEDRRYVLDTVFGCGSKMIAQKETFGNVPDLSGGHGILGSDGQGSRKGGRSQPLLQVPSITLLLIPPPDASPPVKS